MAATVSETIDERDRPWGGMGDRIRDARPTIRKHMNMFVEGERAGLETPLAPGAEVYVRTAISGGRRWWCEFDARDRDGFLTEADPIVAVGALPPPPETCHSSSSAKWQS